MRRAPTEPVPARASRFRPTAETPSGPGSGILSAAGSGILSSPEAASCPPRPGPSSAGYLAARPTTNVRAGPWMTWARSPAFSVASVER